MTTITAMVIADSVAPSCGSSRLTTMQLRYPRWIHAEFMTHRVFSRNASSSRAVPVKRLIQDVLDDPAVPLFWGKNEKGMQATEECNAWVLLRDVGAIVKWTRKEAWLHACNQAVEVARAFDKAGYHKQLVNRLLEPFSHINVVVTATEWDNFFALRAHPDAEPHIHMLADAMRSAMAESRPRVLEAGQWHTPYCDAGSSLSLGNAIQCSVARCARVSYKTMEGNEPKLEADLELYERLMGAEPIHASPAEHQAQASSGPWANRDRSNFHPQWLQYRKWIEPVQ